MNYKKIKQEIRIILYTIIYVILKILKVCAHPAPMKPICIIYYKRVEKKTKIMYVCSFRIDILYITCMTIVTMLKN